jgi:hypothetical protein
MGWFNRKRYNHNFHVCPPLSMKMVKTYSSTESSHKIEKASILKPLTPAMST